MKKHKIGLATVYILIVCVLLLVVNAALGYALMRQSSGAMNTLTRRHMLAVAYTAAAALNGDELDALTEEDASTRSPAFTRIYDSLAKIKNAQEDSDIKYIYATKKGGEHYVFTVDPDPDNPGEFGQDVVYTPAQDVAWSGVSAVDDNMYQDEWGSFYTAWSPVKDSSGKVVGLVGVDFVADWFNQQINAHTRLVVIFATLSIAVGLVIMLLMAGQLRSRIRRLNSEMTVLSDEIEKLSDEIRVAPQGESDDPGTEILPDGSETIATLSVKLRVMQKKLADYMDYAHKQAFTDTMTGVGNKAAYLDYVKELNEKINKGTAAFSIAVFDINGLKSTNDNFGHECGDRIITDTALIFRRFFTDGQIFRIGGDEFIVVLGPMKESEFGPMFEKLGAEAELFNKNEKEYSMELSFSGGGAAYRPGEDSDFKEVFKRADEAMYRRKDNYYRLHGASRREYVEGEEWIPRS